MRVGAANDIRAMAATPDQIFAAQRAPDAGSPLNANRYRQTAAASFAARSCSTGTPLERRAELCVDPAGVTRVRNGDSGGPVFELRNDGTRWLIGVARQDTVFLSSSQGIVANYVPTAFINSPDGLVGSGDVGPWPERMAGVGPGR